MPEEFQAAHLWHCGPRITVVRNATFLGKLEKTGQISLNDVTTVASTPG